MIRPALDASWVSVEPETPQKGQEWAAIVRPAPASKTKADNAANRFIGPSRAAQTIMPQGDRFGQVWKRAYTVQVWKKQPIASAVAAVWLTGAKCPAPLIS